LCAYCGSAGSSKRCAFCRDVIYCSPGCQQADWGEHRKACVRKFKQPPAPVKPAKPQNPCVKCGKAGTKELGSQWFCSHECCGTSLNDLTSQIKALAQPSEASRATSAENQRIMDFVNSKLQDPPLQVVASGPDSSSNESPAGDAATLAKVRQLLGASMDDATTLQKVRELVQREEQSPPPDAATVRNVQELVAGGKKDDECKKLKTQRREAKESKRLMNFVQGVLSKEPPRAPPDHQVDETLKQIKELEQKQAEMRKADAELKKAEEKQAQFNHYVRGWLQRQSEKQDSDGE